MPGNTSCRRRALPERPNHVVHTDKHDWQHAAVLFVHRHCRLGSRICLCRSTRCNHTCIPPSASSSVARPLLSNRQTMASNSSSPDQVSPAPSTKDSRPGTPNLSTPPTAAADNRVQDDTSKLKTLLSLLRKYVTDAEPSRQSYGRGGQT